MPTQMPARVDPARLARAGARLRGVIDLASLDRLAGQCEAPPRGQASIDIGFGIDGHGRTLIDGTVEASVAVVCQRCLEVMGLPLRAAVRLCVVGGQDEAPADGFEPLELDDETVAVQALVEDELLLALPPAPVHPPGACDAPAEAAPAGPEPGGASPFAALREMMDEQGG